MRPSYADRTIAGTFDAADLDALATAEQRFQDLTDQECTAATRTGRGEVAWCGRPDGPGDGYFLTAPPRTSTSSTGRERRGPVGVLPAGEVMLA